MKNATAGSKTTARDYPIGTRFRWYPGGYWYELINHNSNIPGCCEMRLEGGRNDDWIDYNDAIFSDNRVEIIYPKSDNFNNLYEKLSNR